MIHFSVSTLNVKGCIFPATKAFYTFTHHHSQILQINDISRSETSSGYRTNGPVCGAIYCLLPTPAVQSLNSLNDQIASFMVTGPAPLEEEEEEVRTFCPPEKETLQKSMTLMRHLLVDAQVRETLFSATAACWCHIFILRVRTQNTSLFILFSCLSSQIVVQTPP